MLVLFSVNTLWFSVPLWLVSFVDTSPQRHREPQSSHREIRLKFKIPSPLLPRTGRQAGDGIFFGKKKFPLRPEHLFAGVQMLLKRSGRSPGFCFTETQRSHSQWRDRAGFSPASLFSRLLCWA